MLNTGLETVETVAKVYHPDRKDPMLRFTVPEALTLIEQVSGRLRPIFQGIIPLGSRLTVAQFAQIYRWRGVYDVAGRAWSIWRIARMINPATAATYEMRERLSKSIMHWVKETITGRLSRAYIQEVGAAAVDLYSGELRRASTNQPSAAGRRPRQMKLPLLTAEPQPAPAYRRFSRSSENILPPIPPRSGMARRLAAI